MAAAGPQSCTGLLSSGQRKVVDAFFFSAGFVREDCATEIRAGACYVVMQIVRVIAIFQWVSYPQIFLGDGAVPVGD